MNVWHFKIYGMISAKCFLLFGPSCRPMHLDKFFVRRAFTFINALLLQAI